MRKKLAILVSLSLVVLFCAFVGVPYFQDARLSRATAALKIQPEVSEANHLEEILGEETLSLAIKSLQFGLLPTDKEIKRLKSQLKVSRDENGHILITAKHESLQEAIRIANTVAEAYLDQQTEVRRREISEAIKALNQQLVSQVELTSEHWLAFVKACKSLGYQGPFFKAALPEISDLESAYLSNLQKESPNSDLSIHKLRFEEAKKEYLECESTLETMNAHRQELRMAFKAPDVLVSIHERAK